MRLEYAVEVETAHAARLGQAGEAGFFLGRLDQAAGLRHGGGLALGQRRLGRPAAQAGTKAGGLGLAAAGVEGDVGAAPRSRAQTAAQRSSSVA
jgi:hypothetical protein